MTTEREKSIVAKMASNGLTLTQILNACRTGKYFFRPSTVTHNMIKSSGCATKGMIEVPYK